MKRKLFKGKDSVQIPLNELMTLSLRINIKNNSWWPGEGWRVSKKKKGGGGFSSLFIFWDVSSFLPRKQINQVLLSISLQRTYHSSCVVNDWRDTFGMTGLSEQNLIYSTMDYKYLCTWRFVQHLVQPLQCWY